MFIEASNRSAGSLAVTAVGLQMAIEVTRHFDMAIRWSVHFENLMVSAQRLQEFAELEQEDTRDPDV
jgi:hypothetical protein